MLAANWGCRLFFNVKTDIPHCSVIASVKLHPHQSKPWAKTNELRQKRQIGRQAKRARQLAIEATNVVVAAPKNSTFTPTAHLARLQFTSTDEDDIDELNEDYRQLKRARKNKVRSYSN